MQLQECLTKASGEGRSRLSDAALGTCQLCSEAGEEVVLSLLRSQDGNWRQYAESICGQEDYILGSWCGGTWLNVVDVLDRIRYTSILGNGLISEVNLTILSNSYVLQQCISLDCTIDIRLGLLVQVDNLCIAAALKVEHAIVIPAMLVITDQATLRVSGQGGLAGTGQAEENSGVLTVHVAVCGAVHGSDALQREEVVHHGEHALLHLAAIPGVDDNLLTGSSIESYAGLGVQAEFLVVGNLSLGSVVNNEIRLEVLQLLSGRLDEHVGYEMSLPSNLNDETNRHTGILVGTAESIYNEQLLVGQLGLCQILDSSPYVLAHRMVIVLVLIRGPPYSVLGVLIHNDVLILWRTASIDTGHYINSTQLSLFTYLIALETSLSLFLEQKLIRRIVNNLSSTSNTILAQINVCHFAINLFLFILQQHFAGKLCLLNFTGMFPIRWAAA